MRADEKITADEILDAICEDIKNRLRRNDAFGNNSLCYSGASYKLDIALVLRSRAESNVHQEVASSVGELENSQVVATGTAHAERAMKKTRQKNSPIIGLDNA
jgi:hypothetical protein